MYEQRPKDTDIHEHYIEHPVYILSMTVDELLKQRDAIHSSFTTVRTMINSSGVTGSSSKIPNEDNRLDGPAEDGSFDGKDKSNKKKWFNLNLNRSDKKG
ncbi:hypothetical protein BHM03_00018629 [Ensete ventricosum]|nr:hypothetical protein BHM03_00018629 [Ensete ventricosum]